MMEILVFAGIPVLLLLLLLWMAGVPRNFDESPEEGPDCRYLSGVETAACVRRVFSPEDRDFVERLGSSRLQRIYSAERTRVALYWVRYVSQEIAQIMHQHRIMSRQSRNLKVGQELALTLRYVEFRMLCGLLSFSIRMFGPHALTDMAARALVISQSIGQVVENTAAANRVEPAGNLSGA